MASSHSNTNGCQFFGVWADFAEVGLPTSAGAKRSGEIWLHDSRSCRLGNASCRALVHGRDERARDLSQNAFRFSQQLESQVEALVLSNSLATAAYDTESVLCRLLDTVFGHALAAGSIARQYARATDVIRAEVCSALRVCHAQCARLSQARQAYISSLARLNNVNAKMLVHQQACVFCKGSLVRDLVELERLRRSAKRLQDSRHLIESMKLSKQQEEFRTALGQTTAAMSNDLEEHFLSEKAALQLLHVRYFSRLP